MKRKVKQKHRFPKLMARSSAFVPGPQPKSISNHLIEFLHVRDQQRRAIGYRKRLNPLGSKQGSKQKLLSPQDDCSLATKEQTGESTPVASVAPSEGGEPVMRHRSANSYIRFKPVERQSSQFTLAALNDSWLECEKLLVVDEVESCDSVDTCSCHQMTFKVINGEAKLFKRLMRNHVGSGT